MQYVGRYGAPRCVVVMVVVGDTKVRWLLIARFTVGVFGLQYLSTTPQQYTIGSYRFYYRRSVQVLLYTCIEEFRFLRTILIFESAARTFLVVLSLNDDILF